MSGKAESRLIYNSISTSERVSSLGIKGALIYTWLIPHCDSQGRLQGKPKVVKHLVCPIIDDITVEDVEESLSDMATQDLVILYKDDSGRPLVQIKDWWEWQTGLKYKAPSHYQPPSNWKDKETPRDEYGKFIKEDHHKRGDWNAIS